MKKLVLLFIATAAIGCPRESTPSTTESVQPKAIDFAAHQQALGLESFNCAGSVKVTLTPKKQCGLGDGDAMIQDIGDDLSRNIIIRLESFKDWNRGLAGKLDNDRLVKKFQQEVEIKRIPDSDMDFYLYGLFICSDVQKSGVCGNKHLIDSAMLNYTASISTKDERAETDKIYFFKLILKQGDTCYFSNRRDGGFLNDSTGKYIELLSEPARKNLSKMLSFAQKYEKTLTNYPLMGTSNGIGVRVPFEDEGAVCDF